MGAYRAENNLVFSGRTLVVKKVVKEIIQGVCVACMRVLCLFTEPGGVDSSRLPTLTFSAFGPVQGECSRLIRTHPSWQEDYSLIHTAAACQDRKEGVKESQAQKYKM